MQWLGPSIIYLSSPVAVGVTLWQYRSQPVPLLSISLLGLSALQALFIAGLTIIGVTVSGLEFFVGVFGIR